MSADLNIIIRDIIVDTLKKSASGISETMRGAIANSLTMKLAAAIMIPKSPNPTRGGPTEQHPDAPYCKPDQSCCDFICGN